jgi:hypothetical protein
MSRGRESFVRGLPLLALVMLSALAVGLAADLPRKPVPVPGDGHILDSPIPPGGIGGVQVSQGVGYCVSWQPDGVMLGRVGVPFHKPDVAALDVLDASIKNALALTANQLDVKAALEPDHERRGKLMHEAARLRERLASGVVQAGESYRRPVIGDGPVVCTCATYAGDAVPTANACSGACSNCYRCF